MKKTILIIFLTIIIASCAQNDYSPNELLTKLNESGFRASKSGPLFPMGADVAFWIDLNDDFVKAYKFDSPKKAKEFSEGDNSISVHFGKWSITGIDKESVADRVAAVFKY